MKPQFDVRQKSLLSSTFDRSLNNIDNKNEINQFIEKGQKKTEKKVEAEELKEQIDTLNSRLSDESITSNDFAIGKKFSHLYDSSVANQLKGIKSKGSTTYSIGDLFKQKVEEKVTLKPRDPLEYVRSVVGPGGVSNPRFSTLDFSSLYKPVTSARDILRQRGKGTFFGNCKGCLMKVAVV